MELEIVWLVRAAWITVWVVSILPLVIASIPTSKLNSFRELVLSFAGRGKILHPSSQKFTVPQKFFAHFYVIGVVWTTLLLAATWIYACEMAPLSSEEFQLSDIASRLAGGSDVFSIHKSHMTPVEDRFKVWRAVFLLLLMEIHVLRRLIESFYVFKYSPSARMHILGYFAGLFFYVTAPLSLCSNIAPEVARFVGNQVAEFIANGKSHTSAPELSLVMFISPLMKLGSLQLIGGAIFLRGWIHQRRCHAILGSLRENPSQAKEYIIPYGDWFGMVSSPHFLAEIVLYAGLLIASGGTDITIWLLFGFVAANLTYAAGETHRWYLRKFEDYPANRHAIFPHVY
ncbi:3-oxo-5-alpha-steroid 4-dehydrogenase C-terminal [Arabidopsis thaliana x Arabidopsis arenosa]|uniref:3-oxo-5-alpha-steroid 4-dehydrogenase C-terminal n=1 Tax=Arabidopsis thaliana x Arabidopsis arenosa TaxID=1240361 RepID=A0A8T2B1X9_9BRAS|nr:3-oxo-5-alpha-steroid 4-dehydrogenase C-terminal [Arabidopsis thaliana x Arabidopsis arenosa]